MSCPSELELSMHADGALERDAAGRVAAHTAACADCRALVAALGAEVTRLCAALAADAADAPVPPFARPMPPGALLRWTALVLGAAAAVAAVPALFSSLVGSRLAWLETALSWLDPLGATNVTDVAVGAVLLLLRTGGNTMSSISTTVAATVITGLVVWIAMLLGRRRAAPLALAAAIGAVIVAPAADALEIRHAEGGIVHVDAAETIDDTLIALGDTVEIDGNVEGDLIAVGRFVTLRGRVGGQLITAARAVNIEGDIGGSVIGFGQTLNVSPGLIGRNLFGFANTINASQSTRIGQNAVVFGQHANLAGPIDRDAIGFAEQVEVGNTIGGDLTAYASRVTLLSAARVEGDFSAHVPEQNDVTVAPGAVIAGQRAIEIREPAEHQSRYATLGFYVGELLGAAAAFVTGLIVLVIVPPLKRASLASPGDALATAGIGLVALAAVPVIAVLAAITIIGLPIALLGLALYAAAIYVAKIVLAHFVGRRLLERTSRTPHLAVALLLGLALVIVVVNLPFVGGVLNFVLTIAGLGLIVVSAWRHARPAAE